MRGWEIKRRCLFWQQMVLLESIDALGDISAADAEASI